MYLLYGMHNSGSDIRPAVPVALNYKIIYSAPVSILIFVPALSNHVDVPNPSVKRNTKNLILWFY